MMYQRGARLRDRAQDTQQVPPGASTLGWEGVRSQPLSNLQLYVVEKYSESLLPGGVLVRTEDEGGGGCRASPGLSRQQELHVQRPRGAGCRVQRGPEVRGAGCGGPLRCGAPGAEAPEAWGAHCA